MKYPVVLSSHKRLVIAPEGWFDPIGRIDLQNRTIEIGINRIGEQALAWLLDSNGQYFSLEWGGKLQKSLVQVLGLSRQRELYAIGKPRAITAGEMLALTADHREQFEDAPNTGDLRRELAAVSPLALLDQEFMRRYLGE